jgi:hypothetical protein
MAEMGPGWLRVAETQAQQRLQEEIVLWTAQGHGTHGSRIHPAFTIERRFHAAYTTPNRDAHFRCTKASHSAHGAAPIYIFYNGSYTNAWRLGVQSEVIL